MAFLTHQIDMDVLLSTGISEFDLARKVSRIFTRNASTAVAGYNNNSFDDELIRNLFYRNMKELYDHEWKNENFRFDAYKLVQMTRAFRPEMLEWPSNDDGNAVSLRLEKLSEVNGISHENAHDALNDVYATIGISRIIRSRNKNLFSYCMNLCDKNNVFSMIAERKPLINISPFHKKENNMATLLMPVVADEENRSKFHFLDLRESPEHLLDMTPEEVRGFMYAKKADRSDDDPKIPITSIQANKQPLLAIAEKGAGAFIR